MNNDQSIIDDGDLRKYRTELPNMADDDLDPYQYRLYAHYKRVCGANGGECYEGVRTTAEKTKMSAEKVIATRQWLVDNGWIELEQGVKGVFHITIVDRWGENFVRYSEQSKRKTVRYSEQSTRRPLDIPNGTVRYSERSPLGIPNERNNHIKNELNNTDVATQADAIAQPPLLPVGPSTEEAKPTPEPKPVRESKSKPEKLPEDKALSDLTKAILNAYVDARGKNGVHYAKEGVAAKKLAKEGRTPELVLNCYLWLKQKPFWADKVLPLIKVCEELPEYEKAKGQPGMVIPVSPSGKSKPVGTVLSKAENLR